MVQAGLSVLVGNVQCLERKYMRENAIIQLVTHSPGLPDLSTGELGNDPDSGKVTAQLRASADHSNVRAGVSHGPPIPKA